MAADIAVAILGKISEFLVAPIGRQLGYIVHFSGNVETLQRELENLGNLKDTVQRKVDVATNNVEAILTNVETWLVHVSSVEHEARRIVEDRAQFPVGCLNIKSRHALGRRAKKKTRDIVELQKKGEFREVALPARLIPYVDSTATTLDSREVILNDIIKNLKNEDINMVGICGMGGVGKTTMVDQVLKRVIEENMFDNYAKTVVSQTADTTKIQRDIAEILGLELGENLDLRARRLNQRLEGKKVLIILDDVWKELDLRSLGITLEDGQRRCKIVFTSRTRYLWLGFRSRRCELSLDTLPYNESWNLFKEKIGDFLDKNPDFVPIAEEIVEKCAGLPLALVTLGSSLLWQDKHAWNDTLTKLNTKSGVDETVNVCLRQSYDHLGNEEAQSLLLLCSLFEEDSYIFVKSLVSMGMGLRLFNGINSIEAATDRVLTLVGHLQSRHLVFANSEHRESIKIHDLVRDVLISIAREKGALVLEHGDTLEKSQGDSFPKNFIWISVISKEVRELLPRMQFPRLELLRCSNEELHIPDSCFEGMLKLRVVDLIFPYRSKPFKLPSSLQSLTSLHTLCLRNCRLDDFTAIKFLHSLEILRIADEYIEEMPKEIGHLTNLMVLDMSDCEKLRRISPGIISRLTKLEDLNLGVLEIDWGVEENEQGSNASLEEFNSLSNLHILHIRIMDPRMLPRTPPFGNLKKYQIQICNVADEEEEKFILKSQNYERIFSISHVALEKKFNFLLHNSEALLLMGESTKSLVSELAREASKSIKCLEIRETETPESLVNAMDRTKAPFIVSTLESLTLYLVNNLQQIINAPLEPGNFAKLKEIDVQDCEEIRNIFRLSTAVDIVHLEKIKILDCRRMKEVISWEGREEEAIRKLQFPKLKKLTIWNVPLVSFCKGANEITFDQLEELWLSKLEVESIISVTDENPLTSIFPPKVSFPSLNKMGLWYLQNMKEIWCGQLQARFFINLSKLVVGGCGSLQYVFSAYMAEYLVHLHTLHVKSCDGLTAIVLGPLVAGSLVNLKKLTVWDCNQLRNTFQLSTAVDILHHLEELTVWNWNQLRNTFQLSTAVHILHHLEQLTVWNCGSMEEIISWEGERQDVTCKMLQFPNLRELKIDSVENLKYFCKGANEIEFHQLYHLTLDDVPAVECLVSISDETPLKSLFPHKVSFPSLNKMELWSLKNMKEIWCGQLQAGSFINLSELDIKDCGSLQYVFSACMAKYLLHLHTLKVDGCNSLTEIVQGPLVAGSLVNLKQLYVDGCNQLRNTFQLSTAVDILHHLEQLHVEYCGSMKEIISWEGERQDVTSKLQFPNLRELKIKYVKNLKYFCKGANEIEFHQLYDLTLDDLPAVECLVSVSDETPLKSFFPHKVSFPSLNYMRLSYFENMKEIWCGQLQAGSFINLSQLFIFGCGSLQYVFSACMAKYLVHLHTLDVKDCSGLIEVVQGPLVAGSLVNLKNLTVRRCNQLRNTFQLSTAVDILQHLEELTVDYCGSMEEIISWEGERQDVTCKMLQFPNLRELKIKSVKNLKYFCKGANEIEFHQLYDLTLDDLPAVECLVSVSDETPLKSFFPHKVSFPKLVEMRLEKLNNMKEIWCGQPQADSFYNLSELDIERCDSLEYVFSPCMASYLVHLRKLSIYECRSLKEVVAIKKEVDGQEEEDYTCNSILPKLESVELNKLYALERFCHIAEYLEFHVLNNVIIVDCPELTTFAPGIVHTPNLQHVELYKNWYETKRETAWTGDLNNTIHHLHEDLQQRRRQKLEDENDSENENDADEDS